MEIKSHIGREKQKYKDGYRLVSGYFNFYLLFSGIILKDKKILVISSRYKKNVWNIPKGGWEIDETVENAAIREVGEETGVYY